MVLADDPRFKGLPTNIAPLHERIETARNEREAQPLMTEPKGAKYTWDIFYKGKEGYAEHIQVAFDDLSDLQVARQATNVWLGSIEAETLPRDKDNQRSGGGYAPKTAPQQANPAVQQSGVTPVCPNDGATMQFRAAGVSRNTGNPYPAFWSCTNYQATGCKGRMNA